MSAPAPAAWRSVLFFSISFLQALDNQLIPVLRPILDVEMPGAPSGHLLTSYALGCGLIPILATSGGRGNRARLLTLVSLLALALAAVVFGLTVSFPTRLLMRALAGAASGILSVTLLIGAARLVDEGARARQFTVIAAGYLTALVLGVPLGAMLADHQASIGAIYVPIGAVALLLAPLAAMLFERGEEPSV
jgi:DHA1 family purine base/nucleoside efflux pump-like MFS transporter